MSRIISKLYIASILFSTLAIFGCSSSDDGGGGASVPTGAVVITGANAYEVAVDAISGGNALTSLVPTAANIDRALTPRDLIDLVVDEINNLQDSLLSNIPSGVAIEPIQCPDGGTITGDATETETSASGTFTFNNCRVFIDGSFVSVNGTVTFSASIDAQSNWALNMAGNLSASDGVETMTLSGLDLKQTGNDISGEISINTYTFSVDFTSGGGFLVQLQAAIVGNEQQSCPNSPRSGIVLVTGANNTKSRATINNNGTVTIEFDDGSGTFTEVTEPAPGSPYPCADFFI